LESKDDPHDTFIIFVFSGAPGSGALTPAASGATASGAGAGSFNSSARPNSNGSNPLSVPPAGPLVEDEADRSLLLQMALKCADVGHLAATWEVHHR
jgi:hypothetical protein